ncbi:MAG: hypothetical protein E7249_17515 [Paenibacillaceae bacterium]|nr:hypothetical protein [Paenibacillaceae bacterium]
MSSTNKTSLGLNMWEASDKPVRQDFVNDNTIIDEKITNLNSKLDNVNSNLNNKVNSTDIASEYLGLTVKNTKLKLLIENFNFNNGVAYKSAITLFGWKPTYFGALPQPVSLNSGICFVSMTLDGDNVKISLNDIGSTFTGSTWISAVLFATK